MTTITHLNKVSTIDEKLVEEITKESNHLLACSKLNEAIADCPIENRLELVHKVLVSKQRIITRHNHTLINFIFIAVPYYQAKRQEVWNEHGGKQKGWIAYLQSIDVKKSTYYEWEEIYNNKSFIEEKDLWHLSVKSIVKRMDAELKKGIPSTLVSIKKAEWEQMENNNYMKLKTMDEAREAIRELVNELKAERVEKQTLKEKLAYYETANQPSPRLVETQTEYKVNKP